MKNILVKILLCTTLVVPFFCNATVVGETAGKIISIRTSSKYHESLPAEAETETIFKLSSAFVDCQWVGVKNTDQGFVSILLSAQAQSKEIRVWYYQDKFSPVWGNVCQGITIEVK